MVSWRSAPSPPMLSESQAASTSSCSEMQRAMAPMAASLQGRDGHKGEARVRGAGQVCTRWVVGRQDMETRALHGGGTHGGMHDGRSVGSPSHSAAPTPTHPRLLQKVASMELSAGHDSCRL